MNFVFGTAGFAKEVDWLTHEMFRARQGDIRTHHFVAEDGNALLGSSVSEKTVISESEFFDRHTAEAANVFIAVGSPIVKSKIFNSVSKRAPFAAFPNLIHPGVQMDDRPGRVKMGKGNILCADVVLTTDICLGDFIHLNLQVTVGHDCCIGEFSTISPGAHISGNVTLGARVFIGTGAAVLEKIRICDDVIIGANATVTRNITEGGTYVGTPAVRIK